MYVFDKAIPEPNSGCLLWEGTINGAGYGQFRENGKTYLAHIVAYECIKGAVPIGKELDHLCRTRACIEPNHLDPVTHAENIKRGDTGKWKRAWAAAQTHCKNGHEWTPENTAYFKGRKDKPYRACKACARMRLAKYYGALD